MGVPRWVSPGVAAFPGGAEFVAVPEKRRNHRDLITVPAGGITLGVFVPDDHSSVAVPKRCPQVAVPMSSPQRRPPSKSGFPSGAFVLVVPSHRAMQGWLSPKVAVPKGAQRWVSPSDAGSPGVGVPR